MIDIKHKITEILKTTPLNISQTRRGDNGLRNAEEIAELIMGVLVGENHESMIMLAPNRFPSEPPQISYIGNGGSYIINAEGKSVPISRPEE